MTAPDPYGWCPSILRPMALEDGLMIRIRPEMGEIDADQALTLAELAARFGSGAIELTNRANLQLRGLRQDEYDQLLPELERVGLTKIDRTPSARINIALSPFRSTARDERQTRVAHLLTDRLADRQYADLPQKFGFVIDAGPSRVMADISGDIRIEASGQALLVRAEGAATGRLVESPEAAVDLALQTALWFLTAGVIGTDGRGRMRDFLGAGGRLPDHLSGDAKPNPAKDITPQGQAWLKADGINMHPDTLRRAAHSGLNRFLVTPFRALYLPERADFAALASSGLAWDKPGQPVSSGRV